MRSRTWVAGAVALLGMLPGGARAGEGLEIEPLLAKSGVQLVAVEFWATSLREVGAAVEGLS